MPCTAMWLSKISASVNSLLLRRGSSVLQSRRLSTKVFPTAADAVKDIPSGSKLLIGGFGVCGVPALLIKALVEANVKDLTIVSNNCGLANYGLGWMLNDHQIKRLIASYVGENVEFVDQYLKGEVELEIVPQGSLAERVRAGGAGIPAFYTPSGCSTVVELGGWPIKYKPDGNVEIVSEPKERRMFNNKPYLLESAITGDYALVKAWKADRTGNLVFRKAARNFNPIMCKAARVCIAEVEHLVEAGEIDPDSVDVPGIYVDRLIQGEHEKPIEKIVNAKAIGNLSPAAALRHRIARRTAVEFRDGMCVNLGIGIPSLCAAYIRKGLNVQLQCENGVLGMGPYPVRGQEDPDLINAAKETITVLPGASFFSSDESFAMIRGGHIDLTVLGAIQVSQKGDLANWLIPKEMVKGMGGAMDLVSAPHTRVIVCMEHQTKSGEAKILPSCTLPLTAEAVVDTIITEKCVFKVDAEKGLILTELGEGITLEEVIQSTGCEFLVADMVKPMKDFVP